MKAVVVGGQGFLGSATVRELLARGDEVIVLDRMAEQKRADALFGPCATRAIKGDILDPDSLARAFRGIDEVYHLAGRLGTSELNQCVRDAIETNVTGAVNVFQAAMDADVPALFYASKPNVWLNTYTITKFAAEQFAEMYAKLGARILTLRYFNAYGPGQPKGPVRKIIPTFASQAARGEPLTVYGNGEQTVDMIYADDIARITVRFVRSGAACGVVDCGRGIPMTVNAVARAVLDHFGSKGGVVHLPMRDGETPDTHLVADITALHCAIGPLDFSPWESTLAHTLDSYARGLA